MKSLNMKLVLSAVAVAMLATPAFAQRQHQRQHVQYDHLYNYAGSAGSNETYQSAPSLHYPDFGAGRTGSLESEESGAAFSLGR
jgi:hypothetical protein